MTGGHSTIPGGATMKIAMIDPSLFTLPYDLALCRALAANGCDVTLHGRALRALERVDRETAAEASFYRLSEQLRLRIPPGLFRVVKGFEHAVDLARLTGRLRRARPSVIHFQWSPLPTIDIHAVRAMRAIAPVVLTVHDIKPFNNAPTSALQQVGSKNVWRQFDHLIVHSASSKASLAAQGIGDDRVSVIPHGVLDTAPTTARPIAQDGTLTILLFGRIKAYKGIDVMIEALGRLADPLRRRCRVLIVGESMIPIEPLQARAAALGVSGNIEWDLRYVSDSDMANVFGRADIFAFPYREIDTSGVLMACLPYARPIIASRIGAFATLLQDGVHGRIVPPNDPAALAEAVAALLGDTQLLRRCGEHVGQLAGKIPSWAEIAERTTELYEQLVRARDLALSQQDIHAGSGEAIASNGLNLLRPLKEQP
jgi:glycosyltransferase involved in cell wall biosynthesis